MVYDDIPNRDADDVPERDVDEEDEFQVQRDDEDVGIQQHFPQNEPIMNRPRMEIQFMRDFPPVQIIRFSPTRFSEPMQLPSPRNRGLSLATALGPRPHAQRGVPPPPIAVRIPIYHRPLGGSPWQILSMWYRCRRPPLRNNGVLNPSMLSERQNRTRLQMSLPMPMELRFRLQPPSQLCVSGQVPQRQHRLPRSPSTSPPRSASGRYATITNRQYNHHHYPYGGRPWPPATADARQPKSHLTRRISRRPRRRRCRCKMNLVDLEIRHGNNSKQVKNIEAHKDEEEENDDELICEAFKDLHDDNFSDDDDNIPQDIQISC